jgi:hypothetical protein
VRQKVCLCGQVASCMLAGVCPRVCHVSASMSCMEGCCRPAVCVLHRPKGALRCLCGLASVRAGIASWRRVAKAAVCRQVSLLVALSDLCSCTVACCSYYEHVASRVALLCLGNLCWWQRWLLCALHNWCFTSYHVVLLVSTAPTSMHMYNIAGSCLACDFVP